MQYDPIDYDDIQRRVTQRIQRRYRFLMHSAIFVLAIPFLGMWGSAFGFFVWVAVWVSHLIWLSYHNHVEQAIAHEIDEERERVIKRKRHHAALDQLYQQYDHDDFDDDYDPVNWQQAYDDSDQPY